MSLSITNPNLKKIQNLNPRNLFPTPFIFDFPPDLVASLLKDPTVCCSKLQRRKEAYQGDVVGIYSSLRSSFRGIRPHCSLAWLSSSPPSSPPSCCLLRARNLGALHDSECWPLPCAQLISVLSPQHTSSATRCEGVRERLRSQPVVTHFFLHSWLPSFPSHFSCLLNPGLKGTVTTPL